MHSSKNESKQPKVAQIRNQRKCRRGKNDLNPSNCQGWGLSGWVGGDGGWLVVFCQDGGEFLHEVLGSGCSLFLISPGFALAWLKGQLSIIFLYSHRFNMPLLLICEPA